MLEELSWTVSMCLMCLCIMCEACPWVQKKLYFYAALSMFEYKHLSGRLTSVVSSMTEKQTGALKQLQA